MWCVNRPFSLIGLIVLYPSAVGRARVLKYQDSIPLTPLLPYIKPPFQGPSRTPPSLRGTPSFLKPPDPCASATTSPQHLHPGTGPPPTRAILPFAWASSHGTVRALPSLFRWCVSTTAVALPVLVVDHRGRPRHGCSLRAWPVLPGIDRCEPCFRAVAACAMLALPIAAKAAATPLQNTCALV